VRLFEAIGRRLCDSLDSLLTLKDLKESEERYRRVLTTANEGILMLDNQNQPTFINARMAEMLGYTIEELQRMPVVSFMFEEDLADHRQKTDNRQHGRSEYYERRLRHKNGQVVWARISVVPIVAEDGVFQGSFAMLTDITDKKLAEKELLRLNEELEQRIQRRTSELQQSHTVLRDAYRDLQTAHTRLLQQEKMAAIGQLAAGIAHEINTPTQFVSDNISFLRESFEKLLQALVLCRSLISTSADHQLIATIRQTFDRTLAEADLDFIREEAYQALTECEDGMNRITRTVSAMKDFAQTSGSLQPVELAPLIDSTVEITRTQWHSVARVETEFDPELPIVNGIRSELGAVLLNLIVNAAHAIGDGRGVEPGQGLIRIVTRRNGNWAEIAVSDSGCGIPGELHQKIFEPFFTTREVGKGSGQGLAIAYNIIAGNHHGELLVDSGPEKGSTFTIRLPLAAPNTESAVMCPWPK
jgi:PAS domain S-box-containing protein